MKIVFIIIATILFALNIFSTLVAFQRGDVDPGTARTSVVINSCLTVFGIFAMIFP